LTDTRDKALYPPLPPSQTGMRGRCPRCGEGRLFKGFLDVAPRCTTPAMARRSSS